MPTPTNVPTTISERPTDSCPCGCGRDIVRAVTPFRIRYAERNGVCGYCVYPTPSVGTDDYGVPVCDHCAPGA